MKIRHKKEVRHALHLELDEGSPGRHGARRLQLPDVPRPRGGLPHRGRPPLHLLTQTSSNAPPTPRRRGYGRDEKKLLKRHLGDFFIEKVLWETKTTH